MRHFRSNAELQFRAGVHLASAGKLRQELDEARACLLEAMNVAGKANQNDYPDDKTWARWRKAAWGGGRTIV